MTEATGAALRGGPARPMLDPAWTPRAAYGHAQGLLAATSTAKEKRMEPRTCEDWPCCGHEWGDCDGSKYGSDESIKQRVLDRIEAGEDDWPDWGEE